MLDYVLSAAVTMLVVIDPIGLAPLFLAVTTGLSAEERRHVAWRASAIALAILALFGLIGAPLLAALGITLPAFRIAGGLLLFTISFEMVFGRRSERKTDATEAAMREHLLHNLAVFPLAIPLMAGPGAITAMMLLAGEARGDVARLGALFAITLLVIASCLVVYLAADRVNRWLGITGNAILTRLLGVVLAALAVQFVIDGVKTSFGL
ncbi:multiple antibiotic resistance protein [Ancylobacter sp. 3268]|uniref:MarC family protein n=1 Tax=Ancylobacter sp. 3268 TaxID=2817752 RepID=UPI0028592FBD|nr:MarC family protein [Ancylobacter sp. 3268]MDR6953639.1 multiple antibiotic resistance protein [Ancylobacter sp. 3268]